jgi:hypothetical protein
MSEPTRRVVQGESRLGAGRSATRIRVGLRRMALPWRTLALSNGVTRVNATLRRGIPRRMVIEARVSSFAAIWDGRPNGQPEAMIVSAR